MKQHLLLFTLVLITLLLSGCGTKTYSIKTNSGKEHIARGTPDYNVKNGTYTFTDTNGNTIVIAQDDIKIIQER